MKFKYKKEKFGWVCLINPYGDHWYSFGNGSTKKIARANALMTWNDYNKNSGSNY